MDPSVERFLFGEAPARRFTQDSPILPEVWIAYFNDKNEFGARVDLLLNPHRRSSPGLLKKEVSEQLKNFKQGKNTKFQNDSAYSLLASKDHLPLVYNESHVAAQLNFAELIFCTLPLTKWWNDYCCKKIKDNTFQARKFINEFKSKKTLHFTDELFWLAKLIGYYYNIKVHVTSEGKEPEDEALVVLGLNHLDGIKIIKKKILNPLHSVTVNRPIKLALDLSLKTVKADAVHKLCDISCNYISWAIIDSGVDAEHIAFNESGKLNKGKKEDWLSTSRIVETYDFSRLRNLLNIDLDKSKDDPEQVTINSESRRLLKEFNSGLKSGRMLNWDLLIPLLKIDHDKKYEKPSVEHGTHVAGILGANLPKEKAKKIGLEYELFGMCPDIKIYDLRVLDKDGDGNEFNLLAALQFIRFMNQSIDQPIIHGVNLSLSLDHDVKTSACGRSPVCEECERLVGSGVVVVAAAGNRGFSDDILASNNHSNYQGISITDPGNAENVITVGSTHREMPHTYGVSYFSSRGPTGDGRSKPDIIAPGEKILSTTPHDLLKRMDGTSMAAPHVSGAAALLMARHIEFKGQPMKIKKVLCETATDLGREHHFQGHGLVDILRAIQSI